MPKFDLTFSVPLMNAAGTLGFALDPHAGLSWSSLGAFVTNPLSYTARRPANPARVMEFAGGVLLHSGFPNPGLKTALRTYAGHWAGMPLPVIVHLLVQGPGRSSQEALAQMVRRLEGLDNVIAIELGFPPDLELAAAPLLVDTAAGELPVILRLPLDRALGGLEPRHAEALQALGLAALSLGPPRGALPVSGGWAQGRLYGPSLYPLALRAVQVLVPSGLPVIGGGGVYQTAQVETMLAAGALAVQVDSVLWRGWSASP